MQILCPLVKHQVGTMDGANIEIREECGKETRGNWEIGQHWEVIVTNRGNQLFSRKVCLLVVLLLLLLLVACLIWRCLMYPTRMVQSMTSIDHQCLQKAQHLGPHIQSTHLGDIWGQLKAPSCGKTKPNL